MRATMSNRLFQKGRQNFAAGALAWATAAFILMPLKLDGTLTDTAVKAINAITTATPPVVTTTAAHGFTTGDTVVQRGCTGMLNANGTFKITVISSTTYSLQNLDGGNVVGTGTYSGTACVVNLELASTFADVDGALCTGASTMAAATAFSSKTNVDGLVSAANLTSIPLNDTVHAVVVVNNVSNTAASSPVVHFADGRTMVTVAADAAISATTLWVQPLEGAIPTGTVIQMTNGVTVTTNGAAVAGARSLTVNALSAAVAAGNHGDAQTTNSGLPLSVTAGVFNHTFDATNGIFSV